SDTVRFGRFLAERLGITGVTFTERLPDGPVDNVTAFHVFEHFPDWRLPARELVSRLRPGGVLAVRAPFGAEEPDHDHPQHYPSPVPVGDFLASLGLKPLAEDVWK